MKLDKAIHIANKVCELLAPYCEQIAVAGSVRRRNEGESIKIDIFCATKNNFGYIYAIRTGSADYIKRIAVQWCRCGYKGVDGDLVRMRDGLIIELPTEEDFFKLLNIDIIPPEKRI